MKTTIEYNGTPEFPYNTVVRTSDNELTTCRTAHYLGEDCGFRSMSIGLGMYDKYGNMLVIERGKWGL